jgi:hypothetical protein
MSNEINNKQEQQAKLYSPTKPFRKNVDHNANLDSSIATAHETPA